MSKDDSLRNALRYDFTKRCFLDIADYDYIAARTLFRNSCKDQSLIFMQQCIEKYLKAILLYNKIPHNSPVTKSNHNLKDLLKRCRENILDFKLTDDIVKLIQEINGLEHSRYLAYSYYGVNSWLLGLDKCVWELRIYAQPDMPLYKRRISKIIQSDFDPYVGKSIISNGELERILVDRSPKSKELRSNLVWKNFYYGRIKKQVIKNVKLGSWAKNSPFSMGDDRRKKTLYAVIKDLVFIPKDVRKELE